MPGAIKVAYELQSEIVIAILGAAFLYFVVIKSEERKLEAIHNKMDDARDKQRANPDKDIEMYDLTEDVGEQAEIEQRNVRDQVENIDRTVETIERWTSENAAQMEQFHGRLPKELADAVRQAGAEIRTLKGQYYKTRVDGMPGIRDHLNDIEQVLGKYDLTQMETIAEEPPAVRMEDIIQVKQEPNTEMQVTFNQEDFTEESIQMLRDRARNALAIPETFNAAPPSAAPPNDLASAAEASTNDRVPVSQTTSPEDSAFNHGGEFPPSSGDHTNDINITNTPSTNTAPTKVRKKKKKKRTKRGRDDSSEEPEGGGGSGSYDTAPKRPKPLSTEGAPNTAPLLPMAPIKPPIPASDAAEKSAIQGSFNSSNHPAPGSRPTGATENTKVAPREFNMQDAIKTDLYIGKVTAIEADFMKSAHVTSPTVQEKQKAQSQQDMLWAYTPFPKENNLYHLINERFNGVAKKNEALVKRYSNMRSGFFDEIKRTPEFRAWAEAFGRVYDRNKSFQKKRTVDEMEGGGDEPDPKKTKGTFPPEKELR